MHRLSIQVLYYPFHCCRSVAPIRRAMGVVVRQGISAETSWQEHQKIIDALMSDDVESAENAMRRHIEKAQHETASILSQIP